MCVSRCACMYQDRQVSWERGRCAGAARGRRLCAALTMTDLYWLDADELYRAVGPRDKIQIHPKRTSPAHVTNQWTIAYTVPAHALFISILDAQFTRARIMLRYEINKLKMAVAVSIVQGKLELNYAALRTLSQIQKARCCRCHFDSQQQQLQSPLGALPQPARVIDCSDLGKSQTWKIEFSALVHCNNTSNFSWEIGWCLVHT